MSDKREGLSTQAIVTYILLAQFTLTVIGVFLLIFFKVDPSNVMLGVLGAVISAVTTAVSGAVGYWLGSSASGKSTSDAIAQIAGAGPPPPAPAEPVAAA